MNELLMDAIMHTGQAVFVCPDLSQDQLTLIAGHADWVSDIFPEIVLHQPYPIIKAKSYFLQDFFVDAKNLWGQVNVGQFSSGFWTEVYSEQNLHLDAQAIKTPQSNLLIIRNQAESYIQKQSTLQTARNILLANDNLQAQYEHLHERLNSLLYTSKSLNHLFTPVVSAVENASIGVIILDASFEVIIENPAVYKVFDYSSVKKPGLGSPTQIILKLARSQLPEFERIREIGESWSGELCWMKPPNTLKWLKVAVYPVKDANQNIKNWLFFINDISREKYLLQRNEKLTQQDVLTGLANRYAFWQYLEHQVDTQQPFFLLYIDIANFKQINEFYGHSEGDRLLIELSKRLDNYIEENDFLARVGGDEFSIVLNNLSDIKTCQKACEKIMSITHQPFYTEKDESYLVGLQIGAVHYPTDSSTAEELLKFADLSAYSANKKVKHSIVFYSQELKEASHRRIEIEQALRHAIENDELLLNLQPILNLSTNKIEKAEVLVRWNRPGEGMVMPSEFIEIAEKTGLIVPLGKWVFNKSVEYLTQLEQLNLTTKLSINLSPLQVIDKSFFGFIKSTIEQHQVNPEFLELEVTESSLINDYNQVFKLLTLVRGLGITVSVDDFGTGYSSLAYLKRLPIDILKIDRSFVQDIVTDPNDKAIVMAVIAMAHQLKLKVIAEGVETTEQQNFLIENQCDSAQGYLFSRPLGFEQLKLLLEQCSSVDCK
ncbi:EAL domain-containing protein [Catenovulum sp. 2E275]|uniref:sensor domain-containing protein n=1 Tax=Catenovulum sp. 2E275 TaxID=2980497 RepID=UPI0021D30316|nr:EAL domain-containing protein [Catenovulum sp. 2E275]MCU4675698.1 EAL domain-containing protein [Catenovulum sp. 2E275]